ISAIQIFNFHPYVLAFCPDSTDVYEITDKSSPPRHITSLTPPSKGTFRSGTIFLRPGAVIVDPSRDAIIIVENRLHVWNLHSGQEQRTIDLFGTVSEFPIIYDKGRVLVTLTDEAEEEGEERTDFWILACNPFGLEPTDYDFITQIRIPAPERHEVYNHVLYSREHGVVVGQHISLTSQPLKLHYWSPKRQPDDESQPPTHTISLPMTLDGARSMLAQYAVSIDDHRFVLSTLETVLGSPDVPGSSQTVIRAHVLPSLETIWEADPIPGQAHAIYHLPKQGVTIAFGKANESIDDDDPVHATWIVVVDVEHGKRLQFTKLNHREIEKKIFFCSLTTSVTEEGEIVPSDEPEIVFVSGQGEVATLPIARYLKEGLTAGQFGALEKTIQSSDFRLDEDYVSLLSNQVSIGQLSVAAMGGDNLLSLFTW
ncbi:hypothetical protein V5O48_009775, partial [Marasmius crinis-equi]